MNTLFRLLVVCVVLFGSGCRPGDEGSDEALPNAATDSNGSTPASEDLADQDTSPDVTSSPELVAQDSVLTSSSIDSLSLDSFWVQFKRDLRAGRKAAVVEAIQYPFHAVFFEEIRFAYHCPDTAAYNLQLEQWQALGDIEGASEMLAYYDTLFTKRFNKFIFETTTAMLLNEGFSFYAEDGVSGFTYNLFPVKRDPDIKCQNDTVIKFYFRRKAGQWSFGLFVCC